MPLLKQLSVLAISRVSSITSFYRSISLVELRRKEMTSRKSFWSSRSQTLFFGGREATTGNASAVRRLAWSARQARLGKAPFPVARVCHSSTLASRLPSLSSSRLRKKEMPVLQAIAKKYPFKYRKMLIHESKHPEK